jgi:hypothetical protein
MGISLALIVIGVLLIMERMGTGFGLRQGWPWVVIALGLGGLLRSVRSVPSWVTLFIGLLILSSKYYSLHFRIPVMLKTYFAPVLLILIGLLWFWRYRKE